MLQQPKDLGCFWGGVQVPAIFTINFQILRFSRLKHSNPDFRITIFFIDCLSATIIAIDPVHLLVISSHITIGGAKQLHYYFDYGFYFVFSSITK